MSDKKSLAIAYGMKHRKMASGGRISPMENEQSSCSEHCESPCQVHEKSSGFEEHEGNDKRPNHEATMEDDRKLNEHGEIEEGPEGDEPGKEDGFAEGGQIEDRRSSIMDNEQDDSHEMDMVGRIMKQRQQMFSEGGRVANEAKSNRGTDYLATDDLEFNYTDANSGDELSTPGEDERRKDMVSRIMTSRRKKDRLPNPR